MASGHFSKYDSNYRKYDLFTCGLFEQSIVHLFVMLSWKLLSFDQLPSSYSLHSNWEVNEAEEVLLFVNTFLTQKNCNYTRKSNWDRSLKWIVLRAIWIVLRVIWPICNRYADICKTLFRRWLQACSPIVTTIWRPGLIDKLSPVGKIWVQYDNCCNPLKMSQANRIGVTTMIAFESKQRDQLHVRMIAQSWNRFVSSAVVLILRLYVNQALRSFIAWLKFLYGQSIRFPASFLCLSFPVPFLYIAPTKGVLTWLKAY